MGNIAIRLVYTAALLGATLSQGVAAADETGGSSTVISPEHAAGSAAAVSAGAVGDTQDMLGSEPGAKATITPTPPPAVDSEENAEDVNTSAATLVGIYFGGKFGFNDSIAAGTISAPKSRHFAYGMQGGYLQGGYNWHVKFAMVGVGAYYDWNPYALHSNGVAYSSMAYGLDTRFGLPVEDWLPYIKVGYGHSRGTYDLRTVAQNKSNTAMGVEYNFAPSWTFVAEYKLDNFSSRDNLITISNRTFTFGFNYYFDAQKHIAKKVIKIELKDIPIPEPNLAPDAPPEAPPEP